MKTSKFLKYPELRIYGDAIIAGDWHHPQVDLPFVLRMCNDPRWKEVHTLISNGDWGNQDVYSDFVRKQTGADWEAEKTSSRITEGIIRERFQRWIIIPGNHDIRLQRKTNYNISTDDIARMMFDDVNRITLTDRDYVILNDSWRICHPKDYSAKPTATAESFVYRYGMSVIMGHNHMANRKTFAMLDGEREARKYHAIDGACMLDPNKVEYQLMNSGSFSPWVQGYTVITDNQPTLVTYKEPRVKSFNRGIELEYY